MKLLHIRITTLLLALIVMLSALTIPALVPDAQAYSVFRSYARFAGVSGEALPVGTVVYCKAADSRFYKTRADQALERPARGIVGRAASGAGETIIIITHGILDGWAGRTVNADQHVSDTAGEVVEAAPVWAQVIGYALTATQIYFNFSRAGA